MPRPLSLEPRRSGKSRMPWVVHIPEDARPRYGGQARRYFQREGEAAAFCKALRRHRSDHTAAFNMLPDAAKAKAHEALELLAPYPEADLLAIVRAHVAQLEIAARSKPIGEIIPEMLAEKKTDGRRPRYLSGLRGMLGVFSAAFPDRLASLITPQEISAWLRKSYANPNSRDSYRRSIGVLFSWAKEKGYVRTNPIAETKPVNARREHEVAILSPAELSALFIHAPVRLRPYLAICAFAALRPAECLRLRWEHVKPQGIYVPKAGSKTVARLVPILPALTSWLESFGPLAGKVYPMDYRTWRRDFDQCKAGAGYDSQENPWKQDAIRHSAISFWLAVEPNRAAVAKWSGNSEAVQTRDYDNPRSPEEAAAWYAVLPTCLPLTP